MPVETVTLSDNLRMELANRAAAAGVPYHDFVVDALWRAAREDDKLVVGGRVRGAAATAAEAARMPLSEWVEHAIRAKLAAGPTDEERRRAAWHGRIGKAARDEERARAQWAALDDGDDGQPAGFDRRGD